MVAQSIRKTFVALSDYHQLQWSNASTKALQTCKLSILSACMLQIVDTLQQICQFHQVVTSLLKSGLLQLVICRLATTC